MKTACFLILAVLCLLPNAALAIERTRIALPPTRPLTLSCVVDAARARGLPLAALLGILATENGRMGEALDNKNGTWDLGCFQINTVHLNELAAMGIAPEAVLRDGRVNSLASTRLLGCCTRNTSVSAISGRPSAHTILAHPTGGMPTSNGSKIIW